LKELEDYSWFPTILRRFQMDFIGFVVAKFNFYDVFIQQLKNQNKKYSTLHDLCSGSGEPGNTIFNKSNCFNTLVLTDKFPSNTSIIFEDVLAMNIEKEHCYTMFNAFHHFTDEEKTSIVSKLKVAGAKAYFVEILEPNIIFMIKVVLLTSIANLLITPFIRPFSFIRIIFTYLIPVTVFTIMYDGIISVLKSRSIRKYKEILPSGVQVYKLKRRLSSLIVIEIN